ncbi:MAG: hypothetical protein IJT73_08230 [Selenomonadaceae bacterium]|nr:hypothetical protein [Selenomonadaceae bacterium]
MQISHSALFNALAANYNFGAIWAIEDACKRDLEEAEKEFIEARTRYAYSKNKKARAQAYVDTYYARIRYKEKLAAYNKYFGIF